MVVSSDSMVKGSSLVQGIQGRLVLLILTLLVPMLIVQVWVLNDRFENYRSQEYQANLEIARSVAKTFEAFVMDVVHSELMAGQALVVHSATDQERTRVLDEFRADNPSVRYAYWINPHGLVVASSPHNMVGIDETDRSYYQDIVSGRVWTVSNLFLGKIAGRPFFAISRGIRNEKGELLGIVVCSIDPDRLNEVLNFDSSREQWITILDGNGLLAHRYPVTQFTWNQRLVLSDHPTVKDALDSKESVTSLVSRVTGHTRLTGLTPIRSVGWVAAACREEAVVYSYFRKSILPQAFMFLAIAVLSLLAALVISRSISTPIRGMRKQLVSMQTPGSIAGFPLFGGPVELLELAAAFNASLEALRESEENLHLALKAARAGVWSWDIATGSISWSSDNHDLFGLEPTLGTNIHDDWQRFLHPDDLPGTNQAIYDVFEARTPEYRAEFRVVHPKLGTRWVLSIGRVERAPDGAPLRMLGINLDITDRKLVEADLVESNHKLENAIERARRMTVQAQEASRTKSEFLANMSHELRTPLNAIIGFSELLIDEKMGDLSDGQKDFLENILSSGRHLLSLINEILDLSKIEAGKVHLELSEVELEPLLMKSLRIMEETALKRGIRLIAEIGRIPETVAADERRLKQVIFNLLSNALKFTPDGGEVVLGCTAASSREMPFVEITVRDSGIGIDQEHLERIFRPFEQVENALCSRYQGTGLGLGLSRSLVEMHGGTIWAESEGSGKGSTFRFRLPAREKGRLGITIDLMGADCEEECKTEILKTIDASGAIS